MTFHKHEYFSFEYLDLNNSTKFSLHFLHFFCYLLCILQDQYTKLKLEFNWKPEPPGSKTRSSGFGAKTGDSQAKAMAGAWHAHGAGVARPPAAGRAGRGQGKPRGRGR